MQFGILGPLEVTEEGRPVRLGGSRLQTLLAVLLVHANEVVSYDLLALALWPKRPVSEARNALQTQLSRLRRGLKGQQQGSVQERLSSHGHGYRLRVADEELDALAFEKCSADANVALGEGDWAKVEVRATAALSCWRGKALADFADQEFAQARAAELEERRLAILECRTEARLALGRHREVIGELHQLVSEHPFREGLWAQLMLAFYREGRQAEALRAYRQARDILIEELGVEPGPVLRELETKILEHSPALDVSAAEVSPLLFPAGITLPNALRITSDSLSWVGRGQELAALEAALQRVRRGVLEVVVVSGDPGIGKTRLTAELATKAHGEGATVLVGRCDEEMLRPYQPIAECVSQVLRSTPLGRIVALVGPYAVGLSHLLPELDAQSLAIPERAGGDPEHERLQIFEAAAMVLIHGTATGTVILVIDDLQWADSATLSLLRHVVRRAGEYPVLVVVTQRDSEAVRGVEDPIAALRREVPVTRLALVGLAEAEVQALLRFEGVVAGGEKRELARILFAATDGSPFLLHEIIRHHRRSGQPESLSVLDDSGLAVPKGVEEVVSWRLSRLEGRAREVLTVASVIGLEFPLELLEVACGTGEEEFLAVVEAAQREGLLEEVSDQSCQFGFRHALVRSVLYRGLSSPRRRHLHQRVGEALEALVSNGAAYVPELAHHFCLAGPKARTKAFRYATKAGDRAMSQLAYEEAATSYAAALKAGAGAASALERLQAHHSLALALARSGRTERALEQLDALSPGAASIDVPPALREDLAALRARLLKDHALAVEGKERRQRARKAAEHYEAVYREVERPYSCINAATTWLLAGEEAKALALASRSLDLSRTSSACSSTDAYWLAATEAEALLLLGDVDSAAGALQRAAAEPAADPAARATTKRQLQLLCSARGIDPSLLTCLDT